MYWMGLRSTIQACVKNCRSCQTNKRQKHKYGKLPAKLAITTPWEALCVNLIGPYTLKGKDGTIIDFMCLTMIDPFSSWFEIAELPVELFIYITSEEDNSGTKVHKMTKKDKFDKSSAIISHFVNKTWFSRYPHCHHIIYDTRRKFKLCFETLCDSYGIKCKPTSVKNPHANAILEQVHQAIATMFCTAKIDIAKSVAPSDVDTFLMNAAWAICSTYQWYLNAAIFWKGHAG